jgi:carbon monoxide dehydrogenase subunit G
MAYEIEVPVRHRTLWLAFTDPEKAARAVPGLTVDAVQAVDASAGPEGVSGDVVAGRLRLKVGAGTITYRGTARIADADAHDGTLDIAVDVAQARGNGALAGYLRITLTPRGEKTTVSVVPELELSGRALEFGSVELAEAASALAGQWLTALGEEWAGSGSETVEGAAAAAAAADAAAVVEATAIADVEDETVADVDVDVEDDDVAEAVESADAELVAAAAPPATSAAAPASSSTPETLLDDSLSADPLATVWRGETEKSPWPRAAAAVGLLLLIRRRRRRRRGKRGLTS